MFDPVYADGIAGQGSFKTDFSRVGKKGNYVTTNIPSNVRTAATIYAQHEERSWFSATLFTKSPDTRLYAITAPGAHGDIGGHWQSNPKTQQLTLFAMTKLARRHGVPAANGPMDPQLAAYFSSQYAAEIVAVDEVSTLDKWRGMLRNPANWAVMSRHDFIVNANARNLDAWKPFGYGVQHEQGLNKATLGNLFLIGEEWSEQPLLNHYKRDFGDWYDFNHGLNDFFPSEISSSHFRRMGAMRPGAEGKSWTR